MSARRPGGIVALLALAVLWAWDVGAIAFSPYATAAVRAALAGSFALAIPFFYHWLRKRHGLMRARAAACSLIVCALPALAWHALLRPSNERAWAADQQQLAEVRIDGDRLTVDGVRNFAYRSTSDFDPAWERRSYDLGRIERAWFVVEPFSGFPGAAHAFLSFGFDDGQHLAVSVEIRKETGEAFSPWQGLYRNYELMYVFGDERDLVQLRTEHRRDTVYLYPLRGGRPAARAMLLDVVERANALAREPEFYNSVTNTCTTNIAHHANRLRAGLVPFSWHLLLPGYADERALQLGLIDFDGTIEQARARFRINERANRAAGAADFSARIRDDA